MLQPDAFCEHAMQQNSTAAGALPRTQTPYSWFEAGSGDGKRKRERRRWGGNREGSWNSATDWLRPALCVKTCNFLVHFSLSVQQSASESTRLILPAIYMFHFKLWSTVSS